MDNKDVVDDEVQKDLIIIHHVEEANGVGKHDEEVAYEDHDEELEHGEELENDEELEHDEALEHGEEQENDEELVHDGVLEHGEELV